MERVGFNAFHLLVMPTLRRPRPVNIVYPVKAPLPVILFDGECGLCNRAVRLLMRWDNWGRLRYAPLQGYGAQKYLREHGLPTQEFSSLVLVPDWEHQERPDYLLKTDALVAALRGCGGLGKTMGNLLGMLPRSFRDRGYDVIARWRYRVFGAWRACPLPNAEWRQRIID
jgi:predicted DCC family thiol-disulfide oxidoreductase YuxK